MADHEQEGRRQVVIHDAGRGQSQDEGRRHGPAQGTREGDRRHPCTDGRPGNRPARSGRGTPGTASTHGRPVMAPNVRPVSRLSHPSPEGISKRKSPSGLTLM